MPMGSLPKILCLPTPLEDIKMSYYVIFGVSVDIFDKEKILKICLFDLILYVPSTIFQINRDWSSWVEPVLS